MTVGIQVVAYHNCDDVQLFWIATVDGVRHTAIDDCVGFAIERQRFNGAVWSASEWLVNRVGFDDNPGERSSQIWPFQRYEWTDHDNTAGDTVQYCVHAVKSNGALGTDACIDIAVSDWTSVTVTADCAEYSAYFNRGTVMSQFISRWMTKNDWTIPDLVKGVAQLKEPMRRVLSGELRKALLALTNKVIADPTLDLYLAIYELFDPELVAELVALGPRAHVVLYNEAANDATVPTLTAANVDVTYRKLDPAKRLAHNKFAVITRGAVALEAWTGSTNWSPSGLCTQLNNGLSIRDPQVAQFYRDQWSIVQTITSLPEARGEERGFPHVAGATSVWFTPLKTTRDIKALSDLVANANEMVLYVMFQPGTEPLETILKLATTKYVRGVVSTLLVGKQLEKAGIDLASPEIKRSLVVPEGIQHQLGAWVKEITRAEFLLDENPDGVGYAITHCKMIVIDPFTDTCKVVTGSHNFSVSASSANDENFIVIEGNKALAEAYAVACLAIYDHYRWRQTVAARTTPGTSDWTHLSELPAWQTAYLTDWRKRYLNLWCRVE